MQPFKKVLVGALALGIILGGQAYAAAPVSVTDPATGKGQTVTAAGAGKVDGSAVTQPVSAADGQVATIGAKADAATCTGTVSLLACEKQLDTDIKALPTQAPYANVGGYSFQVSPAIAVQNAAYAAGASLGGTITVSGAARTNGGSGTLTGFRLRSAGGITVAYTIYAWSKTPAATCTDKSAYVSSSSDSAYALPGFPMTITGASPGSWDASTFAQATGVNAVFKNQDTSPGTAIYMCVVAGASVTPATTGDLSLVLVGYQD